MAPFPQDRLVRKEVAIGVIRAFEPPEQHIGQRLLAPMRDVESDDVIFEYVREPAAGLAPARAEDSESELAQKDESVGTGRAAIIDWALKDHYDPSDVTRYREVLGLATGGTAPGPLTGRIVEGFQERLARDQRLRRKKLDNRLEWLITQALETGAISYNDGKIKFNVAYARPAGQTTDVVDTLWSDPNSDPIGDMLERQEAALDTHGVTLNRGICSRKVINALMRSDRWTNDLTGSNPLYTVRGWGREVVKARFEEATDFEFIVYDSVYRTRPIGSNTTTRNRFLSDNKIFMLPSTADIESIDDTVGFGATLTAPHPESGDWSAGFYEWEKDTGPDPWGIDRGTGIKMFPVFPHLDLTWVMTVL